MYTITWS